MIVAIPSALLLLTSFTPTIPLVSIGTAQLVLSSRSIVINITPPFRAKPRKQLPPYQPFQDLYQSLKNVDPKLFTAMDRISGWLRDIVQIVRPLDSAARPIQATSGTWAYLPRLSNEGSFYTVTDRGNLVYQYRSGAWYYLTNVWRDLFANLPTGLNEFDAGLLFEVVDYAHIFRWDGVGWIPYNWEAAGQFTDFGTIPPITHRGTCNTNGTAVAWVSGPLFDSKWGTVNRIGINGVFYAIASIATNGLSAVLATSAGVQTGVIYRMYVGWHYCDGNGDDNLPGGNVNTLAPWSPPVTLPIVIPDLTTSGAYRKAGNYDGVINVAVDPTVSGATDAEATHTHDIEHTHGTATTSTVTANKLAAGGGDATPAHSHNVDVPTFSGDSGVGTSHDHAITALVMDVSGGDPIANYLVLPWYRK